MNDYKRGSTNFLHKIQIPLSHFTGSNLWLLKPSFLNRGRGIYVIDSVEDMKSKILESINQSYGSPTKGKGSKNAVQRSQTTAADRRKT